MDSPAAENVGSPAAENVGSPAAENAAAFDAILGWEAREAVETAAASLARDGWAVRVSRDVEAHRLNAVLAGAAVEVRTVPLEAHPLSRVLALPRCRMWIAAQDSTGPAGELIARVRLALLRGGG